MKDTKQRGFFTRAEKKPVAYCKGKKVDSADLNQMIQERAYFMWEELGRPQGQDLDIWKKAEKDIYAKVKR